MLAERTASVASRESDDPPRRVPNGAGAKPTMLAVDLFQYLAEVGVGLAIGLMLDDTAMFCRSEDDYGGADSSYRSIELSQTRRQLQQLVRRLPARERDVIQLHYQQGHTFDDIARNMGLTKGRISQIHKKAMSSLRQMLASRDPFDRAF